MRRLRHRARWPALFYLAHSGPHSSIRLHIRYHVMLTIRPFQAHEWRLYRELRLAALFDAPDAFGSTLAREQALTGQEWITRLAAGAASQLDLPLVAEDSRRAVGLSWARIDANDASTVTLYQVWVDPGARRRGIGQRLLAAAMDWARGAGASMMKLSVATGPNSAIEFYRRAGFVETGDQTPLRPGSELLQQSMTQLLFDDSSAS
jgi:ribosomal protein S18 acetylase RimI-like enzyme